MQPRHIQENTLQKVVIRDELASLEDYWSQKVIAEANGQLVKVAKGIGLINWHHHDDQDELFILYDGRLTIELKTDTTTDRTEEIHLADGELFVVPKGVEHRVRAEEEAAFLIVGLNVTSTRQGGKPAWSFSGRDATS